VDVNEVAAAAGLRVVGRTRHGESASTFDVRTADGTDAVLKVHEEPPVDADAQLLLDCIVGPGYPAAIPIEGWTTIDGRFYELQPRLPGEPVEQITAAHLSSVRALNEMQRGAATESLAGYTWLDDVIRTVVEGADGYCEHDAMQRHSDATRALLDRLATIADTARDARVPIRDVVHYDFSPYNILAEGDRITGVVDWEGVRAGDASFDLVTLAFYTYDYAVRDELLAMTRGRTPPRALALYAAHMVLRQVDWSLRHDPSTLDWFVGIGEALLGSLAHG
jgi:Ser/Thr protein kinase RdoA (MazF antagonist)